MSAKYVRKSGAYIWLWGIIVRGRFCVPNVQIFVELTMCLTSWGCYVCIFSTRCLPGYTVVWAWNMDSCEIGPNKMPLFRNLQKNMGRGFQSFICVWKLEVTSHVSRISNGKSYWRKQVKLVRHGMNYAAWFRVLKVETSKDPFALFGTTMDAYEMNLTSQDAGLLSPIAWQLVTKEQIF